MDLLKNQLKVSGNQSLKLLDVQNTAIDFDPTDGERAEDPVLARFVRGRVQAVPPQRLPTGRQHQHLRAALGSRADRATPTGDPNPRSPATLFVPPDESAGGIEGDA